MREHSVQCAALLCITPGSIEIIEMMFGGDRHMFEGAGMCTTLSLVQLTVSFHNFKSQNFKLSVSNPKSTYVAYLSVLSQISNCQGLGRKNKHECLTTDRTCCGLPRPPFLALAFIHEMIY